MVFFPVLRLNVTKATERVQAFVSGRMLKGTFSVQVGRQGRTPNRVSVLSWVQKARPVFEPQLAAGRFDRFLEKFW